MQGHDLQPHHFGFLLPSAPWVGVLSLSLVLVGSSPLGAVAQHSATHMTHVPTPDTWSPGVTYPGLWTFQYGPSYRHLLSCPSKGNCASGGVVASSHGGLGVVGDMVNGSWHAAAALPGLAALTTGQSEVDGV